MKIIFTGGGTAGHVYPAVSIIDQLNKENFKSKILYIGVENGVEQRIAFREDIPFASVTSCKLNKKKPLTTTFNLAASVVDALRIFSKFKPDMVVSTGGYVSFSTLLCAKILRIPYYLHEQNSVLGKVNRSFQGGARKLFLTYENTLYVDPKSKKMVVGNPVRKEFRILSKGLERKNRIAIIGGSGGARFLNELAMLIHDNAARFRGIEFVIVTGPNYKNYFDKKDISEGFTVKSFEEDMPGLFASIDLVITRSGSSTLSEITSSGLASILVPSPNVTDNHQYHNSKQLVDRDAAYLVDESNFNEEDFLDMLEKLIVDDERLLEMKKNSLGLYKDDSAKIIVESLRA